jgi:isoleucyl-tRNA synthetase
MLNLLPIKYDPIKTESEYNEFWVNNYFKIFTERYYTGKKKVKIFNVPYPTNQRDIEIFTNKFFLDAIAKFHLLNGDSVSIAYQPSFSTSFLIKSILLLSQNKNINYSNIEDRMNFYKKGQELLIESQKDMISFLNKSAIWMEWDKQVDIFSLNIINKIWEIIKILYGRGKISYDSHVVPWCFECKTAVPDNDYYIENNKEKYYIIRVNLKSSQTEYLALYTDKIWQLPNMVNIAVNPDKTYVKLSYPVGLNNKSETIIIQKDYVQQLVHELDLQVYKTEKEFKGSELKGLEYVHPLHSEIPYYENIQKSVNTIITSSGVFDVYTGIVPIIPNMGIIDEQIKNENKLDDIDFIKEDGTYITDIVNKYAGYSVYDAESMILKDLMDKNVVLSQNERMKNIMKCKKCGKPIVFKKSKGFYVIKNEIEKRMQSVLPYISFHSEDRSKIEETLYKNAYWGITTNQIFGIPFPAWECTSCKEIKLLSNTNESQEAINHDKFHANLESIPTQIYKCPKCGSEMHHMGYMISMDFVNAVHHYLLENESLMKVQDSWKQNDIRIIAEPVFRKWHSDMITTSLMLSDECPINVFIGYDKIKIKNENENIHYMDVISKYGYDNFRYTILKNIKFNANTFIQESQFENTKKIINTLWNIVRFYGILLEKREYHPGKKSINAFKDNLRKEDLWILSEFEQFKMEILKSYSKYEFYRVISLLEKFIKNTLSKKYLKILKGSIVSVNDEVSYGVCEILHTIIVTLSQILLPIAPSLAEKIYALTSNEKESASASTLPSVDESMINKKVETNINMVFRLVSYINKNKKLLNRPYKWPVKRMVIRMKEQSYVNDIQELSNIIAYLTNTKKVEVLYKEDEWDELETEVIPNPNVINKVYRQWAPKIGMMLKYQSPKKILEGIRKGVYMLGIEGNLVRITPDMISFRYKVPSNWISLDFWGNEIFIDSTTDENDKTEYLIEEIKRKIQSMRKDLNLTPNDLIDISIKTESNIQESIESKIDQIKDKINARNINFVTTQVSGDYVVEWEINNAKVVLGIFPIYMEKAISEFLQIPGVTPEKAKLLINYGFTSIEKLRNASIEELINIPGVSRSFASKIIEYAVNANKNIIKCPKCGNAIPIGTINCPYCKTNIETYNSQLFSFKKEALSQYPTLTDDEISKLFNNGIVSTDLLVHTTKEVLAKIGLSDTNISKILKIEFKEETSILKQGSTYLIKEDKPRKAYELFVRYNNAGTRGLCITRDLPDKVIKNYGIKKAEIIWLTNVGKDNSIRPKDLEKLNLVMDKFLEKGPGIILLDGIEYLITNNNFLTILKLIQSIKDQVAISNSILIIPIYASTFDNSQLTLLEREVDEIL